MGSPLSLQFVPFGLKVEGCGGGGLELKVSEGFEQSVHWEWGVCSQSLSLRLKGSGKRGCVSSKPQIRGPEVLAPSCPPR